MMNTDYDYVYKLVLIGDVVGKTCVLRRFTEGVFITPTFPTIGELNQY